ncbi:MAG: tetratricopeptide repeat-containing sulfotransferase family protein [Rhodospirillales bacterium]
MTDSQRIIRELQGALEGGDASAALSLTARYFAEEDDVPAEVWFLRGQAAERAGDYAVALDALAHSANGRDAAPTYRFYYGCFLLNTGCPWAAGDVFASLAGTIPDNPDLASARARALLETGRYAESANEWEKLLVATKSDSARLQAAVALAMSGAFDDAATLLDGSGSLYPGLIVELHGRGNFRAALHFAREATDLFPGNARAWNDRGIVGAALDDVADAVDCYQKALSLTPGDPDILFNLGSVLASSGSTDAAVEVFERALSIRPDDIRVLRYYADIAHLDADDPAVAMLETLAADGTLSDYDRAAVSYALGKACDDQGRHGEAMRRYLAGGAARGRTRNYGADDEIALLERIQKIFTALDPADYRSAGHDSARPVFIVGLPRSGTTLVEQILAGHDDVTAGGELPFLRDAVLEVIERRQGSRTLPAWEFPDDGARPGPGAVSAIAERYSSCIDGLSPDCTRLVDKQPLNDRYLGFAALAFPNATFIHCVRDLRDTGVSCLSKNFEAEFAFTDTLEGMAAYALAQRRLMAFWEGMFPGRIVTADYEALVADPETEARKLVAAVGLDWSDKCLDLASSDRTVKTASAQQVRQDVYSTAVNRWARYMPEIEPMVTLLDTGE